MLYWFSIFSCCISLASDLIFVTSFLFLTWGMICSFSVFLIQEHRPWVLYFFPLYIRDTKRYNFPQIFLFHALWYKSLLLSFHLNYVFITFNYISSFTHGLFGFIIFNYLVIFLDVIANSNFILSQLRYCISFQYFKIFRHMLYGSVCDLLYFYTNKLKRILQLFTLFFIFIIFIWFL